MTAYSTSRYDNAVVYRIRTADGERIPAVYAPEWMTLPVEFTFTGHTVVEGDRLDVLAYHYYGTPEAWWLIARANPHIGYPSNLVPGTVLRIPDA